MKEVDMIGSEMPTMDEIVNEMTMGQEAQPMMPDMPQMPPQTPQFSGLNPQEIPQPLQGMGEAPLEEPIMGASTPDVELGTEEETIVEPTYEFTISEEKLEEIKKNVLNEIERADRYYEEEIESDIIRRHKVFEGDTKYYEGKFPRMSKITDVTASDFHDTVEWAIPSLIKVFFGSEDICKLQGANSEQDDRAAQAHGELIKFQLERLNDGFLIFYDWIKNALVDNIGFLKCYWEREETVDTKEMVVSMVDLQQMNLNQNITILEQEMRGPDSYWVKYEEVTNITKNQPKLEVVPPSEFRFDPEAKSLTDIKFVAHRRVVTLDYLRRREREGIFQNIDKVIDEEGLDGSISRTMYDTELNPRVYNKLDNGNLEDAKKEFLLYECYVKTDVNEDDMLEDIIITIVGKTVVRLEENTMGRHPFFAISPIRDTLRLFPKRGIADLVSEIQDLNTALYRQIVYNIATNNDKQAFVNIDVLVDPNEFIDGKKAIRVNGDPAQAVKWAPIEPLQPQTFNFLERIQSIKENRTGITRYNQGMDSQSLNKTATGISKIMDASNQRLELIARMFAETGVKELFRHMIKMNQIYITEETFIRVTDKRKPIFPEDLEGRIDITVNVGVAAGSKQTQFSNLTSLLQYYPKLIQAGIADISHAAYAFGRLVELMGYKNVSDFEFPADIIKEAQMQGVNPAILMMIKHQQETGQTPPALQNYVDNTQKEALQEVAAQRGLLAGQQQEGEEKEVSQAQPAQEPARDLNAQQYIQRRAPQPNAVDEARRSAF